MLPDSPVRMVTQIIPGPPPVEVIEAFESGVVNVTRRVEIYEADGYTPWNPDGTYDEVLRMIDGSVSVDYDSSERRKLDLTLDDKDGLLTFDPVDGLWYDKIIKIFYGCTYQAKNVSPRAVIVDADSEQAAINFATYLASLGFVNTDVNLNAATTLDIQGYTYVFTANVTRATTKATLLQSAYAEGVNVVTYGVVNSAAQIPFYASYAGPTSRQWGVAPAVNDNPAQGAFVTQAIGGATTGSAPTAIAAGGVKLALWNPGTGSEIITAAIANNNIGAYWLDMHLPTYGENEAKKVFRAGLNFMRGYHSKLGWETQLGEFVIDNLSKDRFPKQIKVTGRDYTKKLMTSKISNTVEFAIGTSLRTLVIALLENAGLDSRKSRLGFTTEVLTSAMAFDRGTDRWSIIKAACEAFNYEVFFDNFGYLVARKYIDPTTGPTAWEFTTGPKGNLVSVTESLNDSRIFNHIVVYADPNDGAERLPYFGEAINDVETSPTNVNRIGYRTDPVTTNWLSSDDECVEYAYRLFAGLGSRVV